MEAVPDIVLLDRPMESEALQVLVERFFEDMVKYVVDVEREVTFRLIGRGEPLS